MITPFGNQILIKPQEDDSIVKEFEKLQDYGDVIAIGEDVKKIKVGDKIGFITWGVNDLEIDGQKYYFVPEDPKFILGTIK